jgi:2-C-methyl-D-erythritol 2,4-cyclodiphosphate synthase
MRIGHGFDAHAFGEGRRLVLGGVEIPYGRGLAGHSDADVLVHAIIDALLGAAGLGDIGALFPPDDPRYEGADSLKLLAEAHSRLSGMRLSNVDATVVAQAPRLAGHIPAMRQVIARALGADISAISVKATTTDGMGFTGSGEGIAAFAVVLLE